MAMTNMHCARREGATHGADLGVFVKLLARMLALPLDG